MSQSPTRAVFQRLPAFAMQHQWRFIIAFVLLLIAIATEMTIPWLVKIILDEVVVSSEVSWQHLGWLSAGVFLFYALSSGFGYLQAVAFRHGALLVVNDVRQKLFDHVLHLPMAVFDRESTGKLVSNVTNDTESLREMFVTTVPVLLQGSLKIVAIFIAMAILDWRLMLLSLALIPVMLATMHLYRKLSMAVFEGVRTQISLINARINESLQGMALLQAFRREQTNSAEFEAENQKWYDHRYRSIGMDSLLLAPLMRLIGTLTAAGIVAWFANASFQTMVEIGTLYAFLNYVERFFDPFRQLTMELRKLQVATVASARIFELLDQPQADIKESTHNACLAEQTEIEFKQINFGYDPQKPVLHELSFTAKAGEFTAIVGHSGSGKSSIINLLMRFYQPQSGEILIGGQPLASLSAAQRKQLFALVSQDPVIFNGSVLDNLELSQPVADESKAQWAAEQVNADQFIQRLPQGYHTEPGFGGSGLSVGERQLLALARALRHDPMIFLLDEATANIDSDSEEAVKTALTQIQQGRTLIAVAHRLSTVQNADQILVMDQGRIVQRGTHQQLIAQDGHYRALYLAQQAEHARQDLAQDLGLV